MPEKEKKCIESWKQKLPDYELKLWNENNFDINESLYAKMAYKEQKYAFVSDYVRVKVLHEFGGIYLDTDVEVKKNLNFFLENDVFLGFENRTMVGTGVLGSIKHSSIMKEMLDYYDNNQFIDEFGNIDTTTNVKILNNILQEKGINNTNSEQNIKDIHIYERNVFFPKKINEDKYNTDDTTCTIHHFSGSWLTEKEKIRGTNKIWINVFRPTLRLFRLITIKLIGVKNTKIIENKIRKRMR